MAFDFPSSPSEGQIFNAPGGPSYVFNAPTWRAVGQGQIAIISDTPPPSPANGALWYESDSGVLYIWYNDGNSSQWVQVGGTTTGMSVVQTVLTTSGTYTKPAGLRFLEVWVVGGGGGTSGAAATPAAQAACSGSAGGGGTAYQLYAASELSATEAYVVGAGGSAVGGSGGNSTFKGLTGGGGGAGGSTTANGATLGFATGGNAGAATGGTLNIPGGYGGQGIRCAHAAAAIAEAGVSGGSFFAQGVAPSLSSGVQAGFPGTFPGGGARGAAVGPSAASGAAGAVGGAGCIILKEYF